MKRGGGTFYASSEAEKRGLEGFFLGGDRLGDKISLDPRSVARKRNEKESYVGPENINLHKTTCAAG